ncbi:hypothetical protein KIPB_002816 [Kipferlia bialata]|uniref:Uncharacterized protein n=1 Tax=Kipferlia bialata TaxID=797122 RepID=A0A391NPV5_9EUKA|nr:hypothetical protein KIPB_002816 [Kipferlia bialata]|eukprot:g2816.t1
MALCTGLEGPTRVVACILTLVGGDVDTVPHIHERRMPFPDPLDNLWCNLVGSVVPLAGRLWYVNAGHGAQMYMSVCDLSAEPLEWKVSHMQGVPRTASPILFSVSERLFLTGFDVAETWECSLTTKKWHLYRRDGHRCFAHHSLVVRGALHCLKASYDFDTDLSDHRVFSVRHGWRDETQVPDRLDWCAVFRAGRCIVGLGVMPSLTGQALSTPSMLTVDTVTGGVILNNLVTVVDSAAPPLTTGEALGLAGVDTVPGEWLSQACAT